MDFKLHQFWFLGLLCFVNVFGRVDFQLVACILILTGMRPGFCIFIIIPLILKQLTSLGVLTIPKVVRRKEELLNSYVPDTWQALTSELQSRSLCVKPARDGCSTGVARLWYEDPVKVILVKIWW